MTTAERMVRVTVRAVVALALMAILLWPGEWRGWRVRVALGGGMDQVVVSSFTVAELKANKEDYYYEGKGPVDCTESLFGHGGNDACWRLRKKPEVVVRY
jgi:hypothetical protein